MTRNVKKNQGGNKKKKPFRTFKVHLLTHLFNTCLEQGLGGTKAVE